MSHGTGDVGQDVGDGGAHRFAVARAPCPSSRLETVSRTVRRSGTSHGSSLIARRLDGFCTLTVLCTGDKPLARPEICPGGSSVRAEEPGRTYGRPRKQPQGKKQRRVGAACSTPGAPGVNRNHPEFAVVHGGPTWYPAAVSRDDGYCRAPTSAGRTS